MLRSEREQALRRLVLLLPVLLGLGPGPAFGERSLPGAAGVPAGAAASGSGNKSKPCTTEEPLTKSQNQIIIITDNIHRLLTEHIIVN